MTRVLQVMGRSAGGIARHVAQVTEALDGRDGLRVDIAAPSDLPLDLPKPAIEVHIPDGPVRGHAAAVRRLRLILSRASYDVVHAHGLRAGIDGALAARRAGVPSLLTVHNLVQPEIAGGVRARLYRAAEPLAARLAHRTFAVSDEIARHLRRNPLARGAAVEVLYLGVGSAPAVARDRAAVRAELGVGERPLIVTASRLSPQKALHVMVAALALLPEETTLAVLGEGELQPRLEEHARRAGVDHRVLWLGFRADVADYVAAADVFCLSSIWEGIPLSVQESILLGTPVVATAVGGLPEIVEDGESGRLVPRDDPAALAGALAEVLMDRNLAARYAAAARGALEERFSTVRMLERLSAAYRSAGGR